MIRAGTGVDEEDVEADPCGTAVAEVEAGAFVGTVVGLVVFEVVVEDVLPVLDGTVVGFVTGGTAVGAAAFFVGAAGGAQAASAKVSTNTVLNRWIPFPAIACATGSYLSADAF